jgi:hypothetical protein
MKIRATFLWSAGNNPAGKFYIGVMSDLAPITLWGPNNAAGQVGKKQSAAEVGNVISKKQKDYTAVDPSQINDKAIVRMIGEIVEHIPKLKGVKYTLTKDGIDFTSSATPPRPKRSKNRDHFWI